MLHENCVFMKMKISKNVATDSSKKMCAKLHSKPSTGIWGLMKCTKLLMDEIYQIGCGKPSTGYWVVL